MSTEATPLQHVQAGDIMAVKVTEAPRHNSATGYGRKIPTPYMLQSFGPSPVWRRVYVMNYGNSGSAYILQRGTVYFLSPGVEFILETARDGGTLETALGLMASWPEWMKDAEHLERPTQKCFHVTTAGGEYYGVSAHTEGDALDYLQARLTGEDSTDTPLRAVEVDTWTAELGTVLHYGPAPTEAGK